MGTRRESPKGARRQAGAVLRGLRIKAGMDLATAAKRVGRDQGWLSRVERGKVKVVSAEIEILMTEYRQEPPVIEAVVELAQLSRTPEWWWRKFRGVVSPDFELFISLEHVADEIREFCAQAVPAWGQTKQYARDIIEAGVQHVSTEEIHQLVDLRMERQKPLHLELPPEYHVILDEAVLHRAVGGREVMRQQLLHLAKLSELRHVQIQVLPAHAGAHAALNGSFTLLNLPAPPVPLVAETGPDVLAYQDGVLESDYYEQPHQVAVFERIWHRLCREAMPTEESRLLLHKMADG